MAGHVSLRTQCRGRSRPPARPAPWPPLTASARPAPWSLTCPRLHPRRFPCRDRHLSVRPSAGWPGQLPQRASPSLPDGRASPPAGAPFPPGRPGPGWPGQLHGRRTPPDWRARPPVSVPLPPRMAAPADPLDVPPPPYARRTAPSAADIRPRHSRPPPAPPTTEVRAGQRRPAGTGQRSSAGRGQADGPGRRIGRPGRDRAGRDGTAGQLRGRRSRAVTPLPPTPPRPAPD